MRTIAIKRSLPEAQGLKLEVRGLLGRDLRHVVVVLVAFAAALLALAPSASAQASFVERFDDNGPTDPGQDGPRTLTSRGWIFRNQSAPRGARSWFDGYTHSGWPLPHAGAGYLAVNSSSAADDGRVSNWAILPAVSGQRAGDLLIFHALDLGGTNRNILQVRYSPSGGTGTGSGAEAVGDFTELLLNLDPIPTGGWNRHAVALPGAGRIALRYYIPRVCSIGCFSSYTGIDTLSVGGAPPPSCNQPPLPTPGQTLTWPASGSPYRVCENIAIPAGAVVDVEPGVRIDFDSGRQLVVSGAFRLFGAAEARIALTHPAVFPPMIEVQGGWVEAYSTDVRGQLQVKSGAAMVLWECDFSGNGMLTTGGLPDLSPYVFIGRTTFTSTLMRLSDSIAVLWENTFTDTFAEILRGYADVTTTNTFTGQGLSVIREDSPQPLYINNVNATRVSGAAGLSLNGGNYLLGPGTVLQDNLYTLNLRGGILPGSSLPLTGNVNNAIFVGNGGFAGVGRWSNLGLPYRIGEPSGSLPGGHLMIDPGVTVEAEPGTGLLFRSTRRLVADGLPTAPIIFKSVRPGERWNGVSFMTNSTEGSRLEYCLIQDANLGVSASDSTAYVDNSWFFNNNIGGNANTYGGLFVRKSYFLGNTTGVSVTDLGGMTLFSPTNPNYFAGNGAAIDALGFFSRADARNVWWGDPSGPRHPQNPGGQGDPIVGPGVSGVSIFPFLSSPPDVDNTPPVVRMVEPGMTWNTSVKRPDSFFEPGRKYIIRWEVQDVDSIVSQRILFSPDGHYQDRFQVVVDNLPADQRSYEWTVPNPGFAVTNQPQFLRVVAVDAAGQEAWDQAPLVVSSGRCSGDITITTDLSGRTFYAGDPIPTITWTGQVSMGCSIVTSQIFLEADGEFVRPALGGRFPHVSTDSARIVIEARNFSNDVIWFFAPGRFAIRHHPWLGLVPPTVQLLTPEGGSSYAGGSVVPISWSASDDEELYSFDIQASYDGGRTWHPIVQDLPAWARSFDWQLPPSGGIADVRVRVIARDIRFQNSASGDDRIFGITPG